jgi:hypothetical protein
MGIVREWNPLAKIGGYWFPTSQLGLVLNGEYKLSLSPDGVLSWPGGKVHVGPTGTPLIKWYGRVDMPNQDGKTHLKQIYPRFSYWDILQSELVLECQEDPTLPACHKIKLPKSPLINPQLFKNQYVLIGLTSENSTGDIHTSIYGGRKYPGVYILANCLDNLLHDEFVLPAPKIWDWGLCLLGVGCMVYAVLRFESIVLAFIHCTGLYFDGELGGGALLSLSPCL